MQAENSRTESCEDPKSVQKENDEDTAERRSISGSPGGAGVFAKRLQRQFSRAQEKVLQKLGKTAETRDAHFERCCQNLNKQQADGSRLLKDLKAYSSSVKAMRDTSKMLSDTLMDLYNTDLQGEEDLSIVVTKEEPLWSNYQEKLADQCIRVMENYMSQFTAVKEKVAKRSRKVVDFDSSRHHLEVLQNAKKKDEVKIAKAKEEFSTAEKIFEDISAELREELPALYRSRLGCYVTILQSVSSLRDIFYHEMCTLNHEVYTVMKNLEDLYSDEVHLVRGLEMSGSKKRQSRVFSPSSFPTLTRKFSFRQSERGKDSDFRDLKGDAGVRSSMTSELQSETPPKASRTMLTMPAPSGSTDSELNFRGSSNSVPEEEEKSKTDLDINESAMVGSGKKLSEKEEGQEDGEGPIEEKKNSLEESGKAGENGYPTEDFEQEQEVKGRSSESQCDMDSGKLKGKLAENNMSSLEHSI